MFTFNWGDSCCGGGHEISFVAACGDHLMIGFMIALLCTYIFELDLPSFCHDVTFEDVDIGSGERV